MPRRRTWFGIWLVASVSGAWFSMPAGGKLELKATSEAGKLRASLTGPARLASYGKALSAEWGGCLYMVDWGDGTISPNYLVGLQCSDGFVHDYRKPGTYAVWAATAHLDGQRREVQDWTGVGLVTVR